MECQPAGRGLAHLANRGVGGAPECLDLRAIRELQEEILPDTDLNQAWDPVPRVVESRLPIADLRREAELSEPARGQIEDDAKNVVRVAQVAGQIENVGYVRPAEVADLLAVQEDPTGIIQPEAAQPGYLFG